MVIIIIIIIIQRKKKNQRKLQWRDAPTVPASSRQRRGPPGHPVPTGAGRDTKRRGTGFGRECCRCPRAPTATATPRCPGPDPTWRPEVVGGTPCRQDPPKKSGEGAGAPGVLQDSWYCIWRGAGAGQGTAAVGHAEAAAAPGGAPKCPDGSRAGWGHGAGVVAAGLAGRRGDTSTGDACALLCIGGGSHGATVTAWPGQAGGSRGVPLLCVPAKG